VSKDDCGSLSVPDRRDCKRVVFHTVCSTRMIWRILGHIPDFAIYDYPAVLSGIVLGDVFYRQEWFFTHCRGSEDEQLDRQDQGRPGMNATTMWTSCALRQVVCRRLWRLLPISECFTMFYPKPHFGGQMGKQSGGVSIHTSKYAWSEYRRTSASVESTTSHPDLSAKSHTANV